MKAGFSTGMVTDFEEKRSLVALTIHLDEESHTIGVGPDIAILYANAILDAAEYIKAREQKS